MQVESTLMNVGDGGPVSREISALTKASTSMVGNPPQTLTPEFRGDANLSQQNKTTPTKDCKALKACLDSSNCNHIPENPLPQQPNNAPMSSPVLASSEKGTGKQTDTPKVRADGSGVFPAPQWSSGVKAGQEDTLNPCHSNVTSSKKSHPQTQSLQSLAPGFQCSAMFKPAQPVAFIPSSNFSPQLCKITLPPALGQIAALRDATSSQFQKEIQPQGSGVGGKSLLRTYPYSLSVGRAPDKKAAGSNLKLKPNHSSSKTTKSLGEHKSLASVVCSPAITLPLQHPSLTSAAATHYTLSPTAAICCSSTLAGITSQSRLLNHLEKANSIDKTAMGALNAMAPSATENHSACSNEQRDVPLDLSAKSKRPKCIGDAPVSAIEPHGESIPRDFLNAKRTHSTAYCSNTQYPVLPNSHRNGSHQKQLSRTQNHQITESKPTWGKGSAQESIKSIPGTYVGVASPILASTLRGKDGKGTFADELQSFAKQEFISIIDQGEHLASGGKKPSCLVKGNQHAQSGKHVKNTGTALSKNCPTKGALSAALLSSANAGSQEKCGPNKAAGPYSAAAVSPTWQPPALLPHKPAPLQRKPPQGSTKTKGTAVAEGSKFKSPSKPEENKWERMKSPLSNLASIVKQQGLEMTAHTNEGSTQASPGTLRKSDVLNPLSESKDVQSKHGTTFEYPPYRPVEKWPSQGESTQVTNRHEMLNAAELSENNTAVHSTRGEHAKQGSSNPTGQTHLFGSNASTNGGRMESKLAQVLEGEISRKESGTSNGAAGEKLEGMVASILTGQRRGGSDALKKTANGTKEESPTKAKAAAIKQKKSSPKKPAKEKPASEPVKKAAGKRKQDKEKTPVKVSVNKKKKQSAPALEQNLSKGGLSPQSTEPNPKDKISFNEAEQAARNKTDKSNPLGVDASVSPKNSTASNKEPEATESSFPRLRRGQRRADDARLDLWGFATPSPPPPLPKDVSPSPPSTPSQPARRPRGRPRSNALPERAFEGKVRTAGVEADTPPHKKRRRCSSKKYETGEYITDKDKLEEGEHLGDALRQDAETPADAQRDRCPSPAAPSPEPPPPPKPSYTRSGSVRYQESEESECSNKPSGKRKFKSKHLSDSDEPKSKTKRSSSGKRGSSLPLDDDSADAKSQPTPLPTPKSFPSSPTIKKSSSGRSSGSDSSPKRPVPPEVRRLIVNKNAGETLLQRAARLGYQDVVQYCLDKDIREVNRRDNAGYTALHEASSRGWTQIVQILLKHGADVNCSAQDGTRPLHDAVASDNLPIVWLLLNHGADPTLATYSGHTPVKLAHSQSMKTFLTEYCSDLEGRGEKDSSLPWDFYSSSLFETDQEPCWDFLLSEENQEPEAENGDVKPERDSDKDCLVFEFSSEPLLPCYHVQVSLTQGFCNWFLLTDVLKRLKMSARIFRARYPHFEVVSLSQAELWRQVSVSQVGFPRKRGGGGDDDEEEEDEEGPVELVCCVPELQRLLGSSVHILPEEDEEEEETPLPTAKCRSR
ncbi:BCL-6 corepressor-like protein 1 isoform X2 [Xiphophorus couchianus]|uniref:BCL-6 corepressor-like protein 1 isoform X2 n=1 Tax=Xiphophorus couchianus TaxID=32473 RepID=UPI001016B497|nr:BCL-6 corepressor-like protein 1 isoform X2 [Xiphophorus couchianus]